MRNNKILIVEDEKGTRELINLYLINRGYTTIEAQNGEQAILLTDSKKPHLVLLGIEMSDINGYDICQKIRESSDVPIIFLSSRKELPDKLKGFKLGADDYITKPFDFEELEARIKINLVKYRKFKNKNQGKQLFFHNLKINVDTYECYLNGNLVHLSTKEIQLLILLAKRPSQVFSADHIYEQIWGYDSTGDVQTVKVHIRNLRSKIEGDAAKPRYILTVRGFGYRFTNH